MPAAASQRILVTGGSGFIGSHLCRRLPNDGRVGVELLGWEPTARLDEGLKRTVEHFRGNAARLIRA